MMPFGFEIPDEIPDFEESFKFSTELEFYTEIENVTFDQMEEIVEIKKAEPDKKVIIYEREPRRNGALF